MFYFDVCPVKHRGWEFGYLTEKFQRGYTTLRGQGVLAGSIPFAVAGIGVAALAPTAWRRAGLAIAGFWWLVLSEAITGKALLFGSPDGTLPRAPLAIQLFNWSDSETWLPSVRRLPP